MSRRIVDIPVECVTEHPRGTALTVRIVPRASRTAIVGRHGVAVKIAVQAPPVDGAANTALCRFLARVCATASADVTIVMGARSRQKAVLIAGRGPEEVRQALAAAAAS